jgi:hypothetical protein
MSTEQYQAALKAHHIGFTVKNNGEHLIVEGPQGYIDAWPSTGKWHYRSTGEKSFGLLQLLACALGTSPRPTEMLHSIKLSQTTVDWLKGVVQNPLWTSPEEEPEEDSRARKEIWDAIQGLSHE